MVDGVLFNLLIIEEWGFSVGEDACLFDEEDNREEASSEMPEVFAEVNGCGDVDDLVNIFTDSLNEDAGPKHQWYTSHVVLEPISVPPVNSLPVVTSKPQGTELPSVLPIPDPHIVINEVHSKDGIFVSNKEVSADAGSRFGKHFNFAKRVAKRTSSCPPTQGRPAVSGPWSLEWADKIKRNESEANLRAGSKVHATSTSKVLPKVLKKKGNDHLRHCARNLKRIARLSDKDRIAVLRALRRPLKQRNMVSAGSKDIGKSCESNSASQSSVNNDWKHWLVLKGNEKVINKDVCDVATTVGLKLQGDTNNNMFAVLSGKGRKTDGSVASGT